MPDGAGDVLRAAAAVALLGAALLLGEDVRAVPEVERADALRALELVGAQGEQVDAERLDVEVDVRRRLDGVDARRGRRDGRGPARPISAIGWIVPTSLFASMIETRIVLSVIAALDVVGVDPAVAVDRRARRPRTRTSRGSAAVWPTA